MKANELMVGDWMKHADGSCCVVSKIESGKGFACRIGNSQYLWDYNNSFEPIPLTKEILKANGFEEDSVYFKYFNDEGSVCYDKRNKLYHLCGNICVDGVIHFVHELQHALRLCGLTELADNFKIC